MKIALYIIGGLVVLSGVHLDLTGNQYPARQFYVRQSAVGDQWGDCGRNWRRNHLYGKA